MAKNVLKIRVKSFVDLSSLGANQMAMTKVKGFTNEESEMEKLVRKMNRNFIIRYQYFAEKQTFLIGAGKYHTLVGKEKAFKDLTRVLEAKESVITIKVRKLLKIDFIQK